MSSLQDRRTQSPKQFQRPRKSIALPLLLFLAALCTLGWLIYRFGERETAKEQQRIDNIQRRSQIESDRASGKSDTCEVCFGFGKQQSGDRCYKCDGKGRY